MKIYLVGGAIRDKLLGLPIKERDFVVVHGTVSDMLARGFRQVGKEFPVFLHPETNEEYALARKEKKVSPGYQGFTFDTSNSVTLEDDLMRRDLTINAMAESEEGILIDPYHGQADLQQKILRHISPAFAEDPVRILRVGRFLARYASFGFTVAPETYQLMQEMVNKKEVDALVAERVWKELERALSEKNPEKFFEVLDKIGALTILFPHLTINGRGMLALKTACQLSHNAAIRFAALLHHLPEDKHNDLETRQIIATLSTRYRIPNYYRELAQLTALHYQNILEHANHFTSDFLLSLFYALDAFRREDRFKEVLIATDAIAQSENKKLMLQDFIDSLQAAKTVNVQKLIEQGFAGPQLADKIKQARKIAIENWLNKNQRFN